MSRKSSRKGGGRDLHRLRARASGRRRSWPAGPRFHDAACRQRARRARLATNNTDLLAAVMAVETAVSEVRRMVLTGEQPPADAGSRLQQTVAELAERLPDAGTAPALVSASLPTALDVAKSVTKSAAGRDDKPVLQSADRPPRGSRRRLGDLDTAPAPRGHIRQSRATGYGHDAPGEAR
ncbi:MAG TPA: hypothetical protein VE196_12985 [Pseudonocardiaceae bacterium]|nr:hypothetical protein [Pseudonocardiaceae bacterium]